MTKRVWMWTIGGLIFGLLLGVLIGVTIGENTLPGWVIITAIGGTLFFGLWGYANEQHAKVRHPDSKAKKGS